MYNQTSKSLVLSAAALLTVSTADAGRVDGPVADSDRVNANGEVSYTEAFKGGDPAAVAVSGDGDTDLDLFIYDEADELVVSDTDLSDQCIVAWVPTKTQRYRIVIKNLGDVYNAYKMIAN
jgi:hypothetical protein